VPELYQIGGSVMSFMKELSIEHLNRAPRLPCDRPDSIQHVLNVINHIELYASIDDTMSLNYIMLQLHLAAYKLEKETTQ
jgi:hypothetical protein